MLLEVKNLNKSYKKSFQIFASKKRVILRDVSFSIAKGQCLGLVGESGSGKSTLGRLILGLEKPDSGEILFHQIPIHKLRNRLGRISVVFQDYTSSINPRLIVEDVISEPLKLQNQLSKEKIKKRAADLLDRVGLDKGLSSCYPHELSGGQAQRVCIARAIATNPEFIVFDEAVSSLDVSTQVQILDLLSKLRTELNISYFFITHDIQSLTYICDSVLFFKDGQVVEDAQMNALDKVSDPYARLLLSSVISF